jgi:hypothetical protein
MREIRPSGSEGGETGQPVFPTSINLFKLFLRGRFALSQRISYAGLDSTTIALMTRSEAGRAGFQIRLQRLEAELDLGDVFLGQL